jgi:hypothetical protein
MRLMDSLPFHPISVIPGLDPGTSFQEQNGWHQDFSLKSSRKPQTGGTRIKSGYECVREDALSVWCKSAPEEVTAPKSKVTASP